MTERTSPGSCDWVPADGREQTTGGSCDWTPALPTAGPAGSLVRRFSGTAWEGIDPERYKAEEGGWTAIARHVLIAGHPGTGFDVRYFEIAPGGHSSLEQHAHAHVVMGIRGRGRILLAGSVRDLGPMDLAFVAPEDPHQLLNPFAEPFGFLCLVDHERDRPRPLAEAEIEALMQTAAGEEIRR